MNIKQTALATLLKSSNSRGGGCLSAYCCDISKAVLNVLQCFRQYYISRPYLKLIIFNLFGKKERARKLKEHIINSCTEPLNNALTDLKNYHILYSNFKNILLQTRKWVESKEFKEEYLQKQHPYPPFFNPKILSDEHSFLHYSKIPKDLAWDLNLPVPPKKYSCFNVSNGLSASAATAMFLKECNVNIISISHITSCKAFYKDFFKECKEEKNSVFFGFSWFMANNYDWSTENAKHFKYLLPKNMPFLYIVRDPISRIRCLLNHVSDAKGYIKKFNLTFNVESLIQKEIYWLSKTIYPTLGALENADFFQNDKEQWETWWRAILATDSIFETFKENIRNVYCVEFNDVKGEKAIDTFSKIADFFGLQMPKDKTIFNNRVWNEMYHILPSTFYVNQNDLNQKQKNEKSFHKIDSFIITITLPSKITEEQKKLVDISCEIEENLTIDETRVLILIKENDLINLRENNILYKSALDYLKKYLNEIKKEINRRKSVIFSEEQILDFFKRNKKSRMFIKNILDSELNYIKKNHPAYINRWKYYLEFEKICAELDGNKN